MSEGLAHPRCRICGAPLSPQTGVGFKAGSVVVGVCEEHAPLVRAALRGARQMTARTLRSVLQRRAPQVFRAGQAAWAAYDALTAEGEEHRR